MMGDSERIQKADALAKQGKFADAFRELAGSSSARALETLAPELLPRAAQYLRAAGRAADAALAFRAYGDEASAREVLQARSRPSQAPTSHSSSKPPTDPAMRERVLREAQAAEKLGASEEAARLYLHAGVLDGAARCFLAAGKHEEALHALLRLPKDGEHYRRACSLAIAIASQLGRVDFQFDQFVASFLRSIPSSDEDLRAFYRAGLLFESQGFTEEAINALTRIVAQRENYADAKERLEALSQHDRNSIEDFARVVAEDEAFERASLPPAKAGKAEETFPSLPQLPQLPTRPKGKRRPAHTTAEAGPDSERPAERRSPLPTAGAPAPAARPAEAVSSHVENLLRNVYEVPSGIIVAGRYEILDLLGRGGMAAVYRARDLELEDDVAIKLFSPSPADQSGLSRFKQEVSLARKISHPNVIRLYDLGSHGSVRFITMEVLRGNDLSDVLDQGRDLTRDLGYFVQACRGVGCMHGHGVVHRDLKPENLFVTDDGVVKLMDFGIAKSKSAEAHLTQKGFTAGTPAYMAPEQIESFATVTHLSDLYSLGVIAYELFTGQLPFQHESQVALLMKQLREPPPPPSHHAPNIPDELEFMILQLLEKDPARRVQSCEELASDMDALRKRLLSTPKRQVR